MPRHHQAKCESVLKQDKDLSAGNEHSFLDQGSEESQPTPGRAETGGGRDVGEACKALVDTLLWDLGALAADASALIDDLAHAHAALLERMSAEERALARETAVEEARLEQRWEKREVEAREAALRGREQALEDSSRALQEREAVWRRQMEQSELEMAAREKQFVAEKDTSKEEEEEREKEEEERFNQYRRREEELLQQLATSRAAHVDLESLQEEHETLAHEHARALEQLEQLKHVQQGELQAASRRADVEAARVAEISGALRPLVAAIAGAREDLEGGVGDLLEDLRGYEAEWVSALEALKHELRLEIVALRRKLEEAEARLFETSHGLEAAQHQVLLAPLCAHFWLSAPASFTLPCVCARVCVGERDRDRGQRDRETERERERGRERRREGGCACV